MTTTTVQNRTAVAQPARVVPKHRAKKAGLWVALVVGAIFSGFPVIWMLSRSFKANPEIFEYPPRLITPGFSFDAYTSILTDPVKLRFFANSYVVALSVTALTLVVGMHAAYAFSLCEFWRKKTSWVRVVAVQAVPPIA